MFLIYSKQLIQQTNLVKSDKTFLVTKINIQDYDTMILTVNIPPNNS